jgi:EmrB/QacA subfamily drug resistance transporter
VSLADAHTRQSPGRTFAVLGTGAMAYVLLQSLVVPALPTLQAALHTSQSSISWILTAYLLSASVATPVLGRLGDMFGKERMLVVVLAALSAGSLIAALTSSIGVMIAARVLQGLGGAVFPLAFGIIRDEFPRERVPTGIAMVSSILGIGAGLGIVLAGPIIETFDYHWIFWFPLVPVLIAAAGAAFVIPESPVRAPGSVNWNGALLLAAWLVCLLVAVSEGSTWGWSSGRVLGLLAAAAVLLAVWIRVESASSGPLVDMRMMRLRGVWTTNLSAMLIGFGMFGSFVLVPQFVQMPSSTGYGFDASVTEAGLFLFPATVAMLVVSPLAGKLSYALGSKLPLMLGALVSASSFVLLAVAHSRRFEIYLATCLLGVGIGLAFSAMANLIVEAVPREQTGVASGMNTIMRTIGGALGSQAAASVVASSAVQGGLPTVDGFTAAFALSAVAMLAAFAAAVAVPARERRSAPLPALDEA